MKPTRIYSYRRIAALFFLIFQAMGVRVLNDIPGRIIIFTFIIFILNRKEIRKLSRNVFLQFFVLCVCYILFCFVKNVTPFYPIMFGWLSALFAMAPYINGCCHFIDDIYQLSRLSVVYSLAHVVIQLCFPFLVQQTSIPMSPKTFLYLFYYNREEGFMGLNRIQGYCWEPSNWNMILNINLLLSLYLKKSYKYVIQAVVAVVTVMSTTGIIVMTATLFMYYLLFSYMSKIKRVILLSLAVAMFGGFAYNELNDKLSNTSGEARNADLYVGMAVAQSNPIWGVDVDNLTKNMQVMQVRMESMQNKGFDDMGLMEREGFVNSFASLVAEWGIPITLLILYGIFNCPLWMDRKLKIFFSLMMLLVLMGTPISRSGFFFFFVFSSLFVKGDQFGKYRCSIIQHNVKTKNR